MSVEFLGRLPFAAPMRYRRNPELQRSYTRRWTAQRKAALLQAVRSGELTLGRARDIYALSIEELRAWERDFGRNGLCGLRAKRVRTHDDEEP